MTTRGFRPTEMREVGRIIVEVLTGDPADADLERLLRRCRTLTSAFPLYPSLSD